MKHDSANDVACPQGATFLQYVEDNTDHNTSTIDGKNTHHRLRSISIANGNFGEISFQRKALLRDKENWLLITSNKGIPIKSYHHPDTPALSKVLLKPIIGNCSMIQASFIDLLWNTSYFFKSLPPSWSGYMSKVSSNDVPPKSIVTMPPIINLHATDMNALYSLLSFIPDQSKNLHVANPPNVTFNQPLYVKAVEIALSMNADIIVRLEGFYQLMSFVGSTGCVMEGSGLQNALGTVYVHMSYVNRIGIFKGNPRSYFAWFSPQKIVSNSWTFLHYFQDFLHQSSMIFPRLLTKFQDFPEHLRSCTSSNNKIYFL